jgi:hypothetical protein
MIVLEIKELAHQCISYVIKLCFNFEQASAVARYMARRGYLNVKSVNGAINQEIK